MQVEIEAGFGEVICCVGELHGGSGDEGRCAHNRRTVAGRGDGAQAWRSTCSPGPCVIGERDRGRSLLGDSEEVCIGSIGQT